MTIGNVGFGYLSFEITTYYSVDWLSFEPESGTVAVGDEVEVTVTFDAAELTEGMYGVAILVGSNDPDDPWVVIPAYFWVIAY